MDTAQEQLTQTEVYAAIDRLVQINRVRCLWFLHENFLPTTNEERLTVLQSLAKYGDRSTFIHARRLSNWLLQNSNELSAEP